MVQTVLCWERAAGQPAAAAGPDGGGRLLHPARGRTQRRARLVGYAARACAQLPRQLPALDRRPQGTSTPLLLFCSLLFSVHYFSPCVYYNVTRNSAYLSY